MNRLVQKGYVFKFGNSKECRLGNADGWVTATNWVFIGHTVHTMTVCAPDIISIGKATKSIMDAGYDTLIIRTKGQKKAWGK